MKIGERSFTDHVKLLAPCFALIVIVWALRLGAARLGLPDFVVTVLSVSAATPLAITLAALLIHGRSFGGYPNLFFSAFLLVAFAQALIIVAIGAGWLGFENIYSYSTTGIGVDPVLHTFGHLLAIPIGSLLGAVIASIFYWLLDRTLPPTTS